MKPCLSNRIWWEIFGFRCLTLFNQESLETMGQRYYAILCQVLFIGLKEDTNTNTTQHILSWKVCKGSTFLRFSKTNRLILSSEKAKVLFDSSSQLWKQRSLFFCHRWPPRKKFRPTMGSKEGWKRSWRQCSRTALIFVGWSGGVSGGTQKLGGFEKWPPFFLWNNIDGV